MEFKKCVIVRGMGIRSDTCLFESDLPQPVYPFDKTATFRLDVEDGMGPEYVKKNFPNLPIEII